jgi:hypothetical protein
MGRVLMVTGLLLLVAVAYLGGRGLGEQYACRMVVEQLQPGGPSV